MKWRSYSLTTWAELSGILNFIMKLRDFLVLGFIWHLEGFGSMENTPTGCGRDLPTILRILKNDKKSRSVNNFLQPLDLDPNRIQVFVLPAKAPPSPQPTTHNPQPQHPAGPKGPNQPHQLHRPPKAQPPWAQYP
jgi:hypothetical protein